jgi:alkylated DNA repair dioxygenase AlkB
MESVIQQELLPFEPTPAVPGFTLVPDYIDAEQEGTLLAHVDSGPWQSDYRRRIQQYGLGYGSDVRGSTPTWIRDFPEWLSALGHRVHAQGHIERFPENCVVNEYIPPLGIGPHKDYPAFGPTVVCISLGSDIVLDMTHPRRTLRVPVIVPARSLWVLTGEARSEWMHGIATRLTDSIGGERRRRGRRVSITFRTAKDPRLVARIRQPSVGHQRPLD